MANPSIPSKIGPFHVVRPLGEGSFGEVFLVERRRLGTIQLRFALKRFAADIEPATDPEAVRTFADECFLLAALRHHHIVQVHQVGVAADSRRQRRFVIVMEYAEGATLAAILDACRRRDVVLPFDAFCALAEQLLDTLEFLEDAVTQQGEPLSIVHRDLKPANLIVTREGCLKVLDFGIAAYHQQRRGQDRSVAVGTPQYMSPEQARGAQLDTRSDLYAVGAILYECLMGEPYVALRGSPSQQQLLHAAATMQPAPRLRRLGAHLKAAHGHLALRRRRATVKLLAALLEPDLARRAPSAHAVEPLVDQVAPAGSVRAGRRVLQAIVDALADPGAPVHARPRGATESWPFSEPASPGTEGGPTAPDWPFDGDPASADSRVRRDPSRGTIDGRRSR